VAQQDAQTVLALGFAASSYKSTGNSNRIGACSSQASSELLAIQPLVVQPSVQVLQRQVLGFSLFQVVSSSRRSRGSSSRGDACSTQSFWGQVQQQAQQQAQQQVHRLDECKVCVLLHAHVLLWSPADVQLLHEVHVWGQLRVQAALDVLTSEQPEPWFGASSYYSR